MTARDGKPCKKCGTSEWDKWGTCKECHRRRLRKWSADNPGKLAEQNRRYRQDKPEIVAEADRRWARANLDKCTAKMNRYRTRQTEAGGSYTDGEWQALCAHYGNKCLRCGRDDVKLTFDHILPVSKGGSSDISNGQPLCKSCNSAKGDRHIDYRPDAGPLRWLQCKLFG